MHFIAADRGYQFARNIDTFPSPRYSPRCGEKTLREEYWHVARTGSNVEQAALRKNGARRVKRVIVTCAGEREAARFVGWKSNLRTLHRVFFLPPWGSKRRDSRGHRRIKSILIVYRVRLIQLFELILFFLYQIRYKRKLYRFSLSLAFLYREEI